MAYNTNQKRHSKGSPSAGAWAPDNARGGAAAAEPASRERLQGSVLDVSWLERDVLPTPRHRKPRDVWREVEVQPSIRSIALEDTGHAFSTGESAFHGGEYRHFDGELYTPILARDIYSYSNRSGLHDAPYPNATDPVEATPEHIASRVTRYAAGGASVDSEEEAVAGIHDAAERLLAVDGELWVRSPEPMYFVTTFGLSGNHGGTSLGVTGRYSDVSHVRSDSVFTLDEFEHAQAHALEVASSRGDTESLARIREAKPIADVDSDRPWVHPTHPIRVAGVPGEYDIPYADRDSLDANRQRLRAIRAAILEQAPEAIVGDASTGGRTVDFTKLTEGTEQSYRHYAKRVHELSAPDLDAF